MVFDEKQEDSSMQSNERVVGEGSPLPEEPSAAGVNSGQQYYLTGTKLYLILTGLGLAVFLMALDIAVIATVRTLHLALRVCRSFIFTN